MSIRNGTMKNLKFVEGITAEDLKEILVENGLGYKVIGHDKRHPIGSYFMDTAIVLDSSYSSLDTVGLTEIIGSAPDIVHKKKNLGCTYFALYKIRDGFDFSLLDELVRFDRGRLIERTRIYFE